MNRALLAEKIEQAICRPPVMQDTRGAVAVIVAIMIVVLLSFGALALDISNAMIARNELQNVADASALAGARQLGVIYQALPQGTPYTTYVLSNPSAVVNAATSSGVSQSSASGVDLPQCRRYCDRGVELRSSHLDSWKRRRDGGDGHG